MNEFYSTSKSKNAKLSRLVLFALLLLLLALIPLNIRIFILLESWVLILILFHITFTIDVNNEGFQISRNRVFGLWRQRKSYPYRDLADIEAIKGGIDPYHGFIPFIFPTKQDNIIKIIKKDNSMEYKKVNIDYEEVIRCVEMVKENLWKGYVN